MPILNAPHIFETALLFLVAFLLGAVVGYLARRLTLPKREPTVAVVEAAPAAPQPQLVVAPTIAPLPTGKSPARRRGRSAASRLAAAAGREPDDEPSSPVPVDAALSVVEPATASEMRPARIAGAATSGIVVPSPAVAPVAPPVDPEPAPAPVRAEDVPQIDEAAHVVEPPVEVLPTDEPATAAEPMPPGPAPVAVEEQPAPVAPDEPPTPMVVESPESAPTATVEPQLEPHPPEPVILLPEPSLSDDDEAAAMRAVEGRTPRRAAPQPVPTPDDAGEVDAAMASARSAVAAATAAATAAIAGSNEPPPALDFEPDLEAVESFLGPAAAESESPTAGGFSFEPLRPRSGYGRPEGLPAPRGGVPDNLKQIKGITPALENSLNSIGIYHFDQVAAWDQKAVIWLDHHLALKGRVGREKWQEQARDLSRRRVHPVRPVRR